jgi:PAS domain S-box-containing protein/putative nucleotidyltransferase with HDIG domain
MREKSNRIIRITNIVAIVLSAIVAILLPLIYFGLSYQYESAVLESEAETFSNLISGTISANPIFWRYERDRLEELLSRHSSPKYKESHRIVDLRGGLITSNLVKVETPVLIRSHDLFDAGNVVARIEVHRSARPILKRTFLLSVLGLVIGLTVFVFLRIVPLRAFVRTLKLLYESEEKFRAITSTAVDGIIVMNNQGHIVYWNPAAERLFGYTQQEAIGKELHLFLAPFKYHGKFKNGFDKFKTTGKGPAIGKTVEFTALRKDGKEVPIEVSTSAIKIKEEWHAVGLVHDITERKHAAEEMVKLYEEIKSEAETSKSLLQLVETLNTSLEEKELVRKVLDFSPGYLKFTNMGLFFYDERLKNFIFEGGYGLSFAEEDILKSIIFKAGDFLAIDKIINGELVIIDNAKESMMISNDLIEVFDMNSALLVPISFRGKVSGMMCGNYKTIKKIERKDLALLKGLADGIGIALQNSKLFRESNDRLIELTNKIDTINAMAQLDREILSSIDKFSIIRTAITLTSRLIPCDRAAVSLKDDDSYMTVTEWGFGKFTNKIYDIKDSRFNDIEMIQGSLFIPEISEESVNYSYYQEQNDLGIKSAMIIPLVSKGEMLGFIDVGSAYYGRLTTEHLSTAEKIASQITVALEHVRLYEDLEQLLLNTVTSLISIIDAKSPWTNGHSERVTKYAIEIAREMGLSEKEINHIKMCGILHDIGKIGTYDDLLNKPDKLTAEEYELVKKHPGKGADIIAPIKQLSSVIPGILHHHERYDGKGYPMGLKGDNIPLCASILSVADSFDSMTADRPYRKSPGREFAISELKRCSGTQFDPKVVEVFLRALAKSETSDVIYY